VAAPMTQVEFDIVRRWRWLWFTISAVVIVGGLIGWRAKGLNLGIDFTGGVILRLGFAQPIAQSPAEEAAAIAKAREALTKLGIAKSQIQVADKQWLLVRMAIGADEDHEVLRDRVRAGVSQAFGSLGGGIANASDLEMVGPVVGAELRRAAVLALILGHLLIMVYLTIRYRFNMALAAILALVHDVFVMAAAASLLRLELNTDFIAALLTVVGYSVNDTVVIFDRIRENRTLHRHAPFVSVANASLIQTMARSINTVATVEFTLISLALFGGGTIRGFAIALIVGITTGCYSSIFNASPLLALWSDWHEWGLARSFRWRAFLAVLFGIVPGGLWYAIALGSGWQAIAPPPHSAAAARLAYDLVVVALSFGIGLIPACYWGESILRVLAGAATPRGARAAIRPTATLLAATSAQVPGGGGPATGSTAMQVAAAAARAEQLAERKERRKQRKAKERHRPGDRKKRF